MNAIFISDLASEECIPQLFDKCNFINTTSIHVYIDSYGGNVYYSNIIGHYLNHKFENIHCCCSGRMMSAAFQLFWILKGSKEILNISVGMDHLSYISVDMMNTGLFKDHTSSTTYAESVTNYNKRWINYTKQVLGYTRKQTADIKNGKDVTFTSDQLCVLLKNYKKNNQKLFALY